MSDVITLITDFGMTDAYVASMKGVLLSINPKITIVDICHSIEPQNIAQAAFVLSTAYPYFPQGTIHVVVVDPGVGSERRAVLLVTPLAFFVAPDNGVLSYVIEEVSAGMRPGELGLGTRAICLSNTRLWRSQVSATFHGRDVFAPVAAHLSLGVSPDEFGEATSSLVTFPIARPRFSEGELIGHVIHIDRFGNLITDVRASDLSSERIGIEVAGRRIEGLSTSYAEGGELLALIGSSGNLEVASRNSSAVALLGTRVGDEVRIIGL